MLTRNLILLSFIPSLAGCAAAAVYDVATMPVRTARQGVSAAAKGYDLLTTSQSEADERRGRTMRTREQRLDRLERRYAGNREDCVDGDQDACREANADYAEIQELLPLVPAVRD